MKELYRFLNKGQHQISSRMKTFLFSLLAIPENFKNTCTAFNLFFFVTQASNTIVESEYSGAILDVCFILLIILTIIGGLSAKYGKKNINTHSLYHSLLSGI